MTQVSEDVSINGKSRNEISKGVNKRSVKRKLSPLLIWWQVRFHCLKKLYNNGILNKKKKKRV